MKLCILHCGHAKTGSSSVQRYLAANAKALAGKGILYPVLERVHTQIVPVPWGGVQHGAALKLITQGEQSQERKSQAAQLGQIMRDEPHEVLLLSAEFLFQAFFYMRETRVLDFLKDQDYEIETLSYLRDQADRMNSAYVQNAKVGMAVGSFDAFCAKRMGVQKALGANDALDAQHSRLAMFFDTVLRAETVGTHHSFRPFGPEVKQRGVENDFMDAVLEILQRRGIDTGLTASDVAGFEKVERFNEAGGVLMVAIGLKLGRQIENQFKGVPGGKFLHQGVFRSSSAAISELRLDDPRYNALTPERYGRIRAEFAASNNAVAQTLWGRNWNEVFPDPDPSQLVSNDLGETQDAELLRQFEVGLKRAQELFDEVGADHRKRFAKAHRSAAGAGDGAGPGRVKARRGKARNKG